MASLFNEGQKHYDAGRIVQAFELYRRAIVQILDHEDVLQKVPGVPEQMAQEVLAIVWINLLACFRESGSPFTQESSPEAYSLVFSFRPTAPLRAHPQFKGTQGKRLLKAMQITASFALGIMAWEKGDRATTSKRYKEALDVAATEPAFNTMTPGLKHLDRVIAYEVQTIRENLAGLIQNDSITTSMIGSGGGLRRDVLNAPHTRIGEAGIAQQDSFVVASDACGRAGCTERGVGFKRCSACKKTAYCSVECQREDWPTHKATHK
ncbi:hypothetical protein DFH07DRAFT_822147 [Mycena maculata]|uniref:MYND-type domain-containing protein n=1 Tax=Mycena maculata TaxID=230809 RepID=A0AAD7J203_9AGAR|nr:hypothetical protein DFH07DRAFT_822147 [Mycena maculata]